MALPRVRAARLFRHEAGVMAQGLLAFLQEQIQLPPIFTSASPQVKHKCGEEVCLSSSFPSLYDRRMVEGRTKYCP
jgi:hypothetical protein